MCCVSVEVCCMCGFMRRRVSTRITFPRLDFENRPESSGLSHAAVCFVPGMHLNQYCSRARRITGMMGNGSQASSCLYSVGGTRFSVVQTGTDGVSPEQREGGRLFRGTRGRFLDISVAVTLNQGKIGVLPQAFVNEVTLPHSNTRYLFQVSYHGRLTRDVAFRCSRGEIKRLPRNAEITEKPPDCFLKDRSC
ncbi:hypothetical protein Enr17x_51610 [Gimesia fumaroli]|uniref:Uncharacterized protein n=1 Tax=Gimesia fumaroli TaxID=2527976 RepID=A0A518IJ61_9PLAN|nr:hypothetical protein Enr17x_51610 [Gimesia fumaroli]